MTNVSKARFNLLFLVIGIMVFSVSMLFSSGTPVGQDPERIAFFHMEIQKDPVAGSGYCVNLVDTLVRKGTLKPSLSWGDYLTGERLQVSFLDGDQVVLHTMSVLNPLMSHRRFEHANEDHRTLSKTSYAVDRGFFLVRVAFDSRIRFMRLEAPVMDAGLQGLEELGLFEVNLGHYASMEMDAAIQTFDVVKVKDNGCDESKIVFAVMGDGYQSQELGTFMTDVNNWVTGQFATSPYDTYESDFNVYAIKVISNVSGAAMDPSNLIDNYFKSTYWYAGIERLLVPTDNTALVNCLADHVPNYDQAVVIVNHSKYGGSGGWVATASTHADGPEITYHEVGHSFVDLADEYWAGSQYAAEKANMTQDNNPATVRWKNHLGLEGIGIYQYEGGYPWYRPHQSCKMRYLGYAFCRVCREATTNVIQALAGGSCGGGGCGGGGSYCSGTNSDGYMHIQRVRLGSIDNNTNGWASYNDFTSQSTTMQIGNNYTLMVNVYYYNWPANVVAAWIDWNGDGDFSDAGENVDNYTGPASTYQGTITPPAGACIGSTRMRVRAFYNVAANPCGSATYGEVEDYTVNITN